MAFEYDKGVLAGVISDAVTNHFLAMIPSQPDAAKVREVLEEAIDVVVRTTSVLHEEFEQRSAEILSEGRKHSKANADRYLKMIMRPGSPAWRRSK